MNSSSEVFGEAMLKHKWADHRIGEVQFLWEAFLKTDFCKLIVQDEPDGGQSLHIKSIDPIPAQLLLAIGDAIHNLKSALDFAINELLGRQNTRLTFPMGETREELVASFRTSGSDPCPACGRGGKGKGRNAAIEVAVPGLGEFITDAIRPYKASGGFLWPLNKLDVRDKHRMLIIALIPQSIPDFQIIDNNNNRLRLKGTVCAGGTINMVKLGAGGLKIQNYGKPTAEIFFHETGVIEDQRVLPTLLNMSQAVMETITGIKEFALAAGWERPG